MLFHLMKMRVDRVAQLTRIHILKEVFYLLRLKASTYKQIGIKLTSLVFGWEDEVRDKIVE
jgi:hypothetical protein